MGVYRVVRCVSVFVFFANCVWLCFLFFLFFVFVMLALYFSFLFSSLFPSFPFSHGGVCFLCFWCCKCGEYSTVQSRSSFFLSFFIWYKLRSVEPLFLSFFPSSFIPGV